MASNQVVIHQPQEMLAQPQFSRDQVDLLKRTIAKGASDDEFKLFLQICQRTGLDPFARQIYCMSRYDHGEKKMSFEASIDGLRLCAERTGKYAGQLGPEWCGTDGQWKDIWLDIEPPAAARVGILRSDFKEPLWGKALFREYVQTTKEGIPNSMWRKMGAGQLAKCAEALGLRKAFPRELSGIYTRDEMAQSENDPAPAHGAQLEEGSLPRQVTQPPQGIGAESRRVPNELKQVFANLDKDVSSAVDAYTRLEGMFIRKGGDVGRAEYNRICDAFNSKYPAGAYRSDHKNNILDLWDALQLIPVPQEVK